MNCPECNNNRLWQDNQAWGCVDCEHMEIGQLPPDVAYATYADNTQSATESYRRFLLRNYFKNSQLNPNLYTSWSDYLGANALTTCESCGNIIEYDEVDENGDCFDCA